MTDVLGYERYGAHGGDWGSTITEQIARSHAKSRRRHPPDRRAVLAFAAQARSDLTPAERNTSTAFSKFQEQQGAYAHDPGPQAADSRRRRSTTRRWDSRRGSSRNSSAGATATAISTCYTKDELLTNVMVYWVTGSIGGAFRLTTTCCNAGPPRWIAEAVKQKLGSDEVPAAFAHVPQGPFASAARVGRALLQCAALDASFRRAGTSRLWSSPRRWPRTFGIFSAR